MTTFKDFGDTANEYSLSVKQFAKLCGTTRDTLRYYYEQEIITPWVHPGNGYHYYSPAQISSFFFISTMRQAGCSIGEIRDIIHSRSKDGIIKTVGAKISDMQRELYRINIKISALHLGMWILGKYEGHKVGVPFMDTLPDISVMKTPIKDNRTAYHVSDIASDISLHLAKASEDETLFSFPSGVTISYENLVSQHYIYSDVISLSFLPADNVSTFPLPGKMAVLCYHDHNAPNIDKTYKKIVSYIKKNRLKACSELYSISLINLYDKETSHAYYKYLFICVESMDS